MMRDAYRLIGVGPAALLGGRDLSWRDGSRIDQPQRLADVEPEGLDTIVDVGPGPARGIVLAFVPGLMIWGGLIALLVKMLR